jgi:hypothetical protein
VAAFDAACLHLRLGLHGVLLSERLRREEPGRQDVRLVVEITRCA